MSERNFCVLNLISAAAGVSGMLNNRRIRLVQLGKTYGTSVDRLFEEPRFDIRPSGGDKVVVE